MGLMVAVRDAPHDEILVRCAVTLCRLQYVAEQRNLEFGVA